MITQNEKEKLIAQVSALLDQLIVVTETDTPAMNMTVQNQADQPIEMLTIKECTEAVKGLTEHTLRLLIAQKKIPYIRTGASGRGKILISKTALVNFLLTATTELA